MGRYRGMSIFETILYHRIVGTFKTGSIKSDPTLLNRDWSRKDESKQTAKPSSIEAQG